MTNDQAPMTNEAFAHWSLRFGYLDFRSAPPLVFKRLPLFDIPPSSAKLTAPIRKLVSCNRALRESDEHRLSGAWTNWNDRGGWGTHVAAASARAGDQRADRARHFHRPGP